MFVIAFITHLIIWRLRVPIHGTTTLLLIFLPALALGLVVFGLFDHYCPSGSLSGDFDLSGYVHLIIFFCPVALSYIILYCAIEEDSPTLTMAFCLGKQEDRGGSMDDLRKLYANSKLIDRRLNALLRAGIVSLEGKRYRLTGKHALFFRVILWCRTKILRRGLGA